MARKNSPENNSGNSEQQLSIFENTTASLPEIRPAQSTQLDDTDGLTPDGKHKHKKRPSGGRIVHTEKPKRKKGSLDDWEWILNH
ncbi:MAG TPA: hypothetical protein PK639_03255 [Candidatus Woesebacteria bacterium]|nr:hypothetical protein [Candidatus Woesebacteria bacterium]